MWLVENSTYFNHDRFGHDLKPDAFRIAEVNPIDFKLSRAGSNWLKDRVEQCPGTGSPCTARRLFVTDDHLSRRLVGTVGKDRGLASLLEKISFVDADQFKRGRIVTDKERRTVELFNPAHQYGNSEILALLGLLRS